MSKIISKAIDVIASSDVDGKLRPLKIKIENKDGTFLKFKVDGIVSKTIEGYKNNQKIVYTCFSILDGVRKEYVIKYDKLNTSWMLTRW